MGSIGLEAVIGFLMIVVFLGIWWNIKGEAEWPNPMYPPEPDDPREPVKEIEILDLNKMTKAQLLEYAESQGLDLPKSWTKAKILARLDV